MPKIKIAKRTSHRYLPHVQRAGQMIHPPAFQGIKGAVNFTPLAFDPRIVALVIGTNARFIDHQNRGIGDAIPDTVIADFGSALVPVEQVFDGCVIEHAESLAQRIAANPPLSVQSTVRVRRWLIDQAERMAVAFTDPMKLYLTDDFREAVAAHIEKREPSDFKGR